MATVEKINLAGEPIGQVEAPAALAEFPCNKELVHQCVVALLANRRQGNASSLTKGEVDRTGRKPWAQKHTGRARAGYFGSPVWRGGGVVFGPKPRSFGKKVNEKSRKAAFFGTLAERLREGSIRVIDSWNVEKPNTKSFAALAGKVGLRSLLFVGTPADKAAHLSTRNLAAASFMDVGSINVYDLATHYGLVISDAAWKQLQDRFTSFTAA